MRVFGIIVGCCLMAMGTIWVLQGVNILPGSFMTGQIVWAYRGAGTAAVGALVLILTWVMARRKRG
jgi:hypothetical protein